MMHKKGIKMCINQKDLQNSPTLFMVLSQWNTKIYNEMLAKWPSMAICYYESLDLVIGN